MNAAEHIPGASTADPSPPGRYALVDTGSSRKVTARSWIVVAVGVAGLLFQLIQVEDRTPMLLYFTVWSAIVTTVSWPFVDTTSSRVFRIAAQAGAIGNLMSGIVYWAVLFPPNGPGKFLLTILANTTLHAVLPLAVLVRLHARPRPEVLSWLQELATASYPLLYLVTSVLLDLAFGIQSPYGFLQLRGGANVLLNSVGLLVVWCVLAAILHGTTRIGQRGSRHAEAST